uniref:Ubiquitin carboxyl-terminal hydrolase n=1 Tax=Plectus sambesii TaxID=2011161 RepID=A0A914XFW4_9BILA
MKRKSAEEEEGKKEVCERANGSSKSNVKKMVAPADTSASTSVANDDKKFAECWRKYGLDSQPCNLHSGSNPKRTNCKDNPYCLYGLGMDKWEKVMGKLKKVTTTAGEDACKRDINKQPCGLCNLGNTCYMNSFLQLWFNDIAFRQCVFDWRPSDDFEPPSSSRMDVQVVMTALQRLFVQMQISPFEDASAQALVDSLRLDNDQQDAQEFATLFFSALEHNLASHPNGAPFRHFINTHFTGETKHKITCANCSRSSERVAKFQSLQLPIENIKSLTEALKAYFGSETLEDYRCDQCNMRGSVEQRAELTRLPPVVVIQLNRYFFDNKGKKKKFNHPVQFRRKMSFVQYAADESEAREEAQYELCAVMVHQGTGADSGHYYDLIKEQVSGSWFKYNDEHVTVVSKAPGVDVESASPRASVAPEEQKGCYAIVYRRMSGNAIVRPRPPADIAQELTDTLHATHERETKLDSLAEELITQRSVSKYDRLSKLWKTLE